MSNINVHELEDQMEEDEFEDELHETVRYLLTRILGILYVLTKHIANMHCEHVHRPLNRRSITSVGYDYIHKIVKQDPTNFREIYRMYPDVFLKLCNILREKTSLQDTRYICIEEMLAMFLLVVGQNTRYCLIRKIFGRSQYNTSQNFNKVLRSLNSIAADMMVKPGSVVPERIGEHKILSLL